MSERSKVVNVKDLNTEADLICSLHCTSQRLVADFVLMVAIFLPFEEYQEA